jgi:chemotaxis protein histidine kinase CheA
VSNNGGKGRLALIAKFQSVAAERLERLNNAFVQLERDPDDGDEAALLMREIHTLKGEAKLMGFADINFVAHRVEDLLIRARETGFRFPQPLGDTVLSGFDIIAQLLSKRSGASSPVDLADFGRRAEQVLKSDDSREPAPPEELAPSPAAPTPARASPSTLRVDVTAIDDLTGLVADLFRHQLTTKRVFQDLAALGEEWLRVIQRLASAQAGPRERATLTTKAALERLQDLNRELTRVVLMARDEAFEGEDHVHELEVTVKGLRLLPLSSLFARYPRAVRDMARDQGKKVQVTVLGGELALDKYILDQVDEPLLHLIRNAVDHGLEQPAEREAAAKPREGRITLSARSAGSHAEIVVADDGRGLSLEVIRDTAVSRGILRSDEEVAPESLMQLVFRMGFSTRSQATDLSGRGIGLDVVKERIERLGGGVGIQSAPGKGTSVVLTVPISVALRRALVVECGGRLFAIPSLAVASVERATDAQVEAAGVGQALRVEDDLIPLATLDELLAVGDPDGANGGDPRIVVVRSHGSRLALRVGHIVGEREFVQRPLDPFLEKTPLLIGVAVLEHADPIFVLNIPEIIRTTHEPGGRGRRAAPPGPARSKRILLVEDSELTRDMVEGVLREMGHDVAEAVNGSEALALVERTVPDLVITDLEMPVMDGFGLIRALRARPETSQVPIVVLSTRGSEEDRAAAAELGADAYLVKSVFREQTLKQTVGRFLFEPVRKEGDSDG